MFYFNIIFTICSMSSNSLFNKSLNHIEKIKTFSGERIKNVSNPLKGSLYSEQTLLAPRFLQKASLKSLVELKGWLKYLELTENQTITPASFKKNKIFYKQKYDGYVDPKSKIPNENYFYFELRDNSLSVYTTSRGLDRKLVQSMLLDNLVPVTGTNPARGGVEDIGNFDEGYCFMLKFVESMKHFIWEICADSSEIKDNWMQAIIRLNQLQAISKKSRMINTYSTPKIAGARKDSYYHSEVDRYEEVNPSGFVLPRTLDKKKRKLTNNIVSSRRIAKPNLGFLDIKSMSSTVKHSPAHSLFTNINSNHPITNLNLGAPVNVNPLNRRTTSVFKNTQIINLQNPNASTNIGTTEKSTMAIPINHTEVIASINPKKQLREITIIGSASNPLITQEVIQEDVQPGFVAGQWSPCSKPCGEGEQTRTLSCVKPDKCSGQVVQRKICNIKACKADVESHMEKLRKVAEGRWEYLGNWSPCSKPCGGGSQSIKRICLGEGNCIGQSTLVKPCNISSCSDEVATKINAQGSLKQCKNLHGEFRMLVESSKEYLPTKVEINMNNVEVSYENDPLHPLVVLELSNLNQIKTSNKYPGCLKLVDNSSRVRLCSPPTAEESTKVQLCEIWVKKIEEFKKKCSNQALEKIINEIQASSSNKDPFKQIDILQNKLKIRESKDNELREKKLLLQFQEFKKQAQELIEKEEAYERKLEHQEKDRIDCEDKKMTSAIQKEEAVANKILFDIQNMTNAEKSYKIKENAIKREMKNTMKKIESQILNKREGLINKIQFMREAHDLKQNSAMKHLLNTKRNIGQKLSGLQYKENAWKCFQIRYDPISIQSYCEASFPDPILKTECAKPEQFCYMCCDKETDVKSKTDITCCYNICDNKPFDLLQCKSFYDKNRINTGVLPDDLLM